MTRSAARVPVTAEWVGWREEILVAEEDTVFAAIRDAATGAEREMMGQLITERVANRARRAAADPSSEKAVPEPRYW